MSACQGFRQLRFINIKYRYQITDELIVFHFQLCAVYGNCYCEALINYLYALIYQFIICVIDCHHVP